MKTARPTGRLSANQGGQLWLDMRAVALRTTQCRRCPRLVQSRACCLTAARKPCMSSLLRRALAIQMSPSLLFFCMQCRSKPTLHRPRVSPESTMPEEKAAANKREVDYLESQKVWPASPFHPIHTLCARPLISPCIACDARATLQKVADSLVSCKESFPELIGYALNNPDPMCGNRPFPAVRLRGRLQQSVDGPLVRCVAGARTPALRGRLKRRPAAVK